MHAYTNDQTVCQPFKEPKRPQLKTEQTCSISITTSSMHCKTCITVILMPLEPSFLPLPWLQQAWSAAPGVEPAQRRSKSKPALHQKQHQTLCLTYTCMLTVCLHETMFILGVYQNQPTIIHQLDVGLTLAGLYCACKPAAFSCCCSSAGLKCSASTVMAHLMICRRWPV